MGKLSAPSGTKVAACGVAGLSLTGPLAAFGRMPPGVPVTLIIVLAFLGLVASVVGKIWCTKLREEGRTKRLAIEFAGVDKQREAKARMLDAVHTTADVSSDQDRIAEARDARRNAVRALESGRLGEIEARPRPRPRGEPTAPSDAARSPTPPVEPITDVVPSSEHGGGPDESSVRLGEGAYGVEAK